MLGLLWLTTRRRSYALPQPEGNAHVAAVRCRGPLVQLVRHLEQNAIRNMDMLFGIGSGVIPGQQSLSQYRQAAWERGGWDACCYCIDSFTRYYDSYIASWFIA